MDIHPLTPAPGQTGKNAVDFESGFTCSRTVIADEIDILGHVNNTVYVRWLQDVAVTHWNHVTSGAMADDHVWVCLRHEIDYRVPLLAGERAEIRTWLGEWSGPRFDRHVDIRREGATRWSAQAKTTWLMITKATGKPRRITSDVLAAFGLTQ